MIQNSPNPDLLFKDLASEQFPDHSLFFTDGSKTDGAAGCVSIFPSKGHFIRHKIANHASIFSIEAIAILYTLDFMIRREGQWIDAAIFTDSQSVLQSVNSSDFKSSTSYLIFLIRNRLFVLHKLQRPVVLAWIPSHIGVSGNEEADREAKSAALEAELLNIPLPPSDLTAALKQTFHHSCDSYFKDIGKNKGAYYTQFFYKFRTKPWFSAFFAGKEKYHRLWGLSLRQYHRAGPGPLIRSRSLGWVATSLRMPDSVPGHGRMYKTLSVRCQRYWKKKKKTTQDR